jgi:hypothetical protein
MEQLTGPEDIILEYSTAFVRAITNRIVEALAVARLLSMADSNIEPIRHSSVGCLVNIRASALVGLELAIFGKSFTCFINGGFVLIWSNGPIFIEWPSTFWEAGHLAH